MKSTGIVRKTDQLGRIVLPKELRRTLDIKDEEPLEIYIDGKSIILQKYSPGCFFCGEIKEIREVKGKSICNDCIQEISQLELSKGLEENNI